MRRIAVVTTTRADYGILQFVIAGLHERPDVAVQLIASGSHLVPGHGSTIAEIVDAGVPIADELDFLLASDSPSAIAKSIGLATIGLGDTFRRLAPDIVVVLGDRLELLAVVQSALIAKIPVAHIHGGEITRGALDDSVRHAITKLSHLHFVATEEFAARVRQLGEAAENVYVTGAPGLDALHRLEPLSFDDLAGRLRLDPSSPFVLLTVHPETLAEGEADREAVEIVSALDRFPDLAVVVTGANADPGRHAVMNVLEAWVETRSRAVMIPSLGHRAYLTALRYATVVVGNSSSGIIEAPSAGARTVNVGDRQAGRPRAGSVIDVEPDRVAIEAAVTESLRLAKPPPRDPYPNPYDAGDASNEIVSVLSSVPLDNLVMKRFVDLP